MSISVVDFVEKKISDLTKFFSKCFYFVAIENRNLSKGKSVY